MLTACGGGSGSAQGNDEPDAIPRPVDPLPGQPGPGENHPNPAPEPKPEPAPEPSPEPGPKPVPGPEPAPKPEPAPQPEPEPIDRNAHLQWETPTTRVDGACLTESDLTAYRISYGLAQNTYLHSADVAIEDLSCTDAKASNACGQVLTCSYTIEDLETASWYFAVQAIDSQGVVSDFSNEAIKTIE